MAVDEVETLFRQWIGLATSSPSSDEEATHLEKQITILNTLLWTIGNRDDLPALIAHQIIRTVVLSDFGLAQPSRDLWQSSTETTALAIKVHHLTILLALQALALGQVVVKVQHEEEEPVAEVKTLLDSQDDLFGVNTLLLDISSNGTSLPVAILCLGWAVVLNSLPPERRFPTPGFGPMQQEFAMRAFGTEGGLLPGLEGLLEGPLFKEIGPAGLAEGEALDQEIARRKVVKDLLMGLSDLIRVDNIQPRDSLLKVWISLFSGGSPKASAILCEDYWAFDSQFTTRRAILSQAAFPQSTSLLLLLSALSGQGSNEPASQEGFEIGPTFAVFDELSVLTGVTLPLISIGEYRTTGQDDDGRPTLRTEKAIVLPGGIAIEAGTTGVIIETEEGARRAVLDTTINAWSLIFDILRASVGIHPAVRPPQRGSDLHLSIEDLGVEDGVSTIQRSGLKLLPNMLHPTVGLPKRVLETLSTGIESPSVALLEIVLPVLDRIRDRELLEYDADLAIVCVDIVRHLLSLDDASVWTAVRSSHFFGVLGKRKSIAANLIHLDASQGDHRVTLAVLRLIGSIVSATSTTRLPDERIVKPALQLSFTSVWSLFQGWRYDDAAKRYELFTFLSSAFTTILAHPTVSGNSGLNEAAEYLVEVFVSSGSSMTYRPLQEVLTHGVDQAERLLERDRREDASLIIESLENAISFLAILLRLSVPLDVPSTALPKSFLSASNITPSGQKLVLVDDLFQMAVYPGLPTSTRIKVLQLLKTVLLSTSSDTTRFSLASLLRDAKATCASLAELATNGETDEIKALTWSLLGTIVLVQPGCALYCIGDKEKEISGILAKAVKIIEGWKDLANNTPRLLASITEYLSAVVSSPRASSHIKLLRDHTAFWTTINDISRRRINAPPTFLLSMHAEDFALRIANYAYEVQIKANTLSLLAAELALVADEADNRPSKARDLVVGLFRSGTELSEATNGATQSSCHPDLHQTQGSKLAEAGVRLDVLKSISLHAEREYGLAYLYDGAPLFPNDDTKQGSVNFALDMLNLNWSMLDADIAVTKAFTLMAESSLTWTDGDPMVSGPALKASVQLAQLVAGEERGGDVMLAIQEQRLRLLVVLLEMACSEEATNDQAQLVAICNSLRQILESSEFPPLSALRHPHLPALHQPLLRILSIVLQAISRTDTKAIDIDSAIEAATVFILGAADAVLDTLVRPLDEAKEQEASADLGSIVSALCEVTRTPNAAVWLDKVAEHNLVSRSLEIITRLSIKNDHVPPHITAILLLHLALASHPLFAERLAISGILPAYSHNAIILEAEQGRIEASSPTPISNTTHGAWCGILTVIKALLSSLPRTYLYNFAKAEVLPFIRVVTPQFLKSLSWERESQLSVPTLDELELVTDVTYGLVQATGPNDSLLAELAKPLLHLLQSIRYSLTHPNTLSELFVPSSEEERMDLEKELEKLSGSNNVELLDYTNTPVIAGRTSRILGITRSVVLTLLTLTDGWTTLSGDEEYGEGKKLILDDDNRSTSEDPIGILTDIYAIVSPLNAKIYPAHVPLVRGALSLLGQLSESTAVLATAQTLYRSSFFSMDDRDADNSMDVDGPKRRLSLGGNHGHSPEKLLRELAQDLIGVLPLEGVRLLVRLREKLEGVFEDN